MNTEAIETHVLPLMRLLPDKRLGAVVQQMILGIPGGQTPVITGMARPKRSSSPALRVNSAV